MTRCAGGPVSAPGRLPDLLVIGAARSGTTSLHHYLDGHPQVFMSRPKELFFFTRPQDERSEDRYRERFTDARSDQLTGEATPEYMLDPEAPGRMASLVPGAKLIAILRHPVDRAYSHYWHLRRRFPVPETFEQLVRHELSAPESEPRTTPGGSYPLLAGGRYLPQLRRVLEHYPREQLLVLLFDDLRDDPRRTFRSLCRFLGVDAERIPPDVGRNYSPTTQLRSEGLRRLMLRTRAYRRLPSRTTAWIERLNRRRATYPPLRPDLRRELLDWYRSDNRALAEWLDRDLSAWER